MIKLFTQWRKGEDAMAAVEAALIFPVLLVMLLGTWDMGYGILAAQKTIRAAQVTADLVARNRNVDETIMDEAVEGGRLAMTPFSTSTYSVDIQSIAFDNNGDAIQLWCDTRGGAPNGNALNNLGDLAIPGEGVIIVTVNYQYQPHFAGFVIDTLNFQEVAFSRGRLTSTVTNSDGQGC